MVDRRKGTGNRGEDLAADYLRGKGYMIIARNWRCKLGELDIVAEADNTLVFVEVRTRRAAASEAALESITQRKVQRLLQAVYTYLNEVPSAADKHWRVDIIGVALPRGLAPIIDHVEDALDW
jgi:putative endonuclease